MGIKVQTINMLKILEILEVLCLIVFKFNLNGIRFV